MLKRFFDPSRRAQKRLRAFSEEIIALHEEKIKHLSDDELKAKTDEFRKRLEDGESLDDLEKEAYAVVREASTRVTGLTPFLVQVMGAKVIHEGDIAEMKTGEGKTLTAVMPAYLNALTGKGVHIITVNDYLARREAEGEIGDIFRFLGLTCGLNHRDLTPEEKKEAYNSDVMYSTNNEVGFDYLRDNMAIYKDSMVQRDLHFAIIDEVDSILIDEARTPLIISGGAKQTANLYKQANAFAKTLEEDDYSIDLKARHATLTSGGMRKAERYFGIDNLYDLEHVTLLHHINNAVAANFIMELDVDYVVKEGEVVLVDQFTGRLMPGRQYSGGLHQALEAKEGVEIKKETTTLASITFQNFFRMYNKLSGMTGTAKTEEEEFQNIYNMFVIQIPTNEPMIRYDDTDALYPDMESKYKALAAEIAKRNKKGQPVLVGTISIESSERISKLLKQKGVKHDVLNAKNHEREAQIIEDAGQKGSVTIATNMAGRGTDIKLGAGVTDLGGLAVIGTERHEARRIDDQLRGRSGRQGDPGYSKFFLSGDDDLVRRFGGDRFQQQLEYLSRTRDKKEKNPLQSKFFARQIKRAQRQIEGANYDRRKTVLQYDEVLRKQREIIYGQRRDILLKEDIVDIVKPMTKRHLDRLVEEHTDRAKKPPRLDKESLLDAVYGKLIPVDRIEREKISEDPEKTYAHLEEVLDDDFSKKEEQFNREKFNEFLKAVVLRVVDTHWVQHIDQMSELRQSVGLQSYGQQNPLREYQEMGFTLFEDMVVAIERDTTRYILRARVRDNLQRVQVAKPTKTSSGKEEEKKKKPVRRKKIGRNEPCPCGSGKKYKHCHGR